MIVECDLVPTCYCDAGYLPYNLHLFDLSGVYRSSKPSLEFVRRKGKRIDMNIPQGSQDGKQVSPRRPGMVTALALLVALDAIGEGCGGLANAVKSSNGLVGEVTAIFMLVLIAVMLALAWGLWQMKNWARVGVNIVIIISILLSIPQFIADTSEIPGLLILVLLLALVFRGAIIYWLAVNGKYFRNAATQGVITGNEPTPAAGDSGSGMAMAMANAGGSGGISRKTTIGLAAGIGLIAISACVAIGYLIYINTRPIATQTLAFGSSGTGQGMFNEPEVIGVDGSGNIVVGDFKDGRVQTFDHTGKFLSLFNVPKGSGGYTDIMGMAVSGDGTIYITGDVDNAILIFNESGQSLGQIAVDQDDYLDIAIAPDGTLYALTDTDLVRFNKDGSVALRVRILDTVETVSSDLAVDSQGNIYVADNYDEVYKLSPTGDLLSKFSRGTGDSYPEKIAVDGYGRIFVTDLEGKNIQVFDASGSHLSDIPGIYNGIAFDQQNNLYANEDAGDVAKFQVRPGGTPLTNYASGNSNNPIVQIPTPAFANNLSTIDTSIDEANTVGVDNNGHIFIGDSEGNVQEFDTSGKSISTISLPNGTEGYRSYAFGKDGKIYSIQAGTIFIFDSNGKLLKQLQDGQQYYLDIALGPDGTLYATEDNNSIVHFDSNGKISLEINKKVVENIIGSKEIIDLITVDGQGNICVVGSDSVFRFTSKGQYMGLFKVTGLNSIAVDSYGRIYADTTNGVQVFDANGTYINSIPWNGTSFIAIDNQDNIYILDDKDVQVFQVQKPAGQ